VLVTRVIAKLDLGGAQLSALRVMRELESRGIRSRLLAGWATPAGIELARRFGYRCRPWNEAGDLQWRAEEGFAAWLGPRLRQSDLVHGHMFGAWWAAARAIDDAVPLVASEHNRYSWPGRVPGTEMAAALRRVDVFFAHGREARRELLARGLPAARMREGASPIDGFDAIPLPGLPTPRIVFAGRIHREKGPDLLVEALGLLRRGRGAGGLPVTLMLGDGPLLPRLVARVRELGLAESVSFTGWVHDPERYIAGATLLVAPSREEALGQTAILGLAHGVPVIGADGGGLSRTLGEGRGILVPRDDAPSLAAAIDRVLRGEAPRLRSARALIERHSPPGVAAVYERAYRGLVATGIGAAARAA
jgi:glycosyltransferase involved in cell wall biosynthesis